LNSTSAANCFIGDCPPTCGQSQTGDCSGCQTSECDCTTDNDCNTKTSCGGGDKLCGDGSGRNYNDQICTSSSSGCFKSCNNWECTEYVGGECVRYSCISRSTTGTCNFKLN